jgi:hypothetical protein
MNPAAWISLGSVMVSFIALSIGVHTARAAARERRLRHEASFADDAYVVLRSLRDAAFGYAIREYGKHDADLLTVAKSAMELQHILPGVADENLAAQLKQLLDAKAVAYARELYEVASETGRMFVGTGEQPKFEELAYLADSAIGRCQLLRRNRA